MEQWIENKTFVYFPSGNLKSIISSNDVGELDGLYIEFFDLDMGQIKEIGVYNNGFEEYQWIEYYESGNIKIIKHFKNGLTHGVVTSYYDSYPSKSRIKTVIEFNNNEVEGYFKILNYRQVIIVQGYHKNGDQVGFWEERDINNGKLMISYYNEYGDQVWKLSMNEYGRRNKILEYIINGGIFPPIKIPLLRDICPITLDPITGNFFKCKNPICCHYFEYNAFIEYAIMYKITICPYDKTYQVYPQVFSSIT
jgi:hypothetical protein